jgi:transposase
MSPRVNIGQKRDDADGHNPILRAFYQRLRTAGKPAKVALTATMRKLLIVLNSTLKSDLSYA